MGEQDGKLDLAKIAGEAKRISEEQAETIRALTDRLGKTERELGEAIKARDEQRGADLAMMEKHVRDFSNRKCFLARLSHILRPAEAPLSVRILSEKDVEWDIAELRMRAGIQFEELAAARSRMMELETDMMTLERDRDGFKIGLQQARERIEGLKAERDKIIVDWANRMDAFRAGIIKALGLGGTGWDDEHLIAAVKKREEDNRSLSVECGRMERDRDGFSKWLKKSEHAMDGFRTRLAHLLGMMESRDAMVPGVDELLHRVADMVRANHAFAAPAGPDPDKYILPGQIELERVLGLIGSALGMEKRDPAPTSDMILAEIERVRDRIRVIEKDRDQIESLAKDLIRDAENVEKWKRLYENMERERDASDRDRQKWMDQTARTDRALYMANERITVLIGQVGSFRKRLTEALAVGVTDPLADEAILQIVRGLVHLVTTVKVHKCRSCGTSEEQMRDALAAKEEYERKRLGERVVDCLQGVCAMGVPYPIHPNPFPPAPRVVIDISGAPGVKLEVRK